MPNPRDLLEPLLALHDTIRLAVLDATDRDTRHALAGVSRQDAADTIYAIDVVAEQVLTRFAARLAETQTFVLVAEGLHGGKQVWPKGTAEADATWRIIVDPIDGTRGLMYQKRSGWILSAAAPNRGPATSLQDVVLAVQTEIPLRKQHLSDHVRAIKGEGVTAHRDDRITGDPTELALRASRAGTIAHGYATVVRFFPGHREQLAAIDDEIVRAALGPGEPGKALCFEDQYASTGGQVYELLAGHDRFIADLRPLVRPVGRTSSGPPDAESPLSGPGLCCHPYDICTALIAAESGVVIRNPAGGPLEAPLDTTTKVAWIGYANERIRQQIEPLLQAALRTRGWI